MSKNSDFNMLKVLGIVPSYYDDRQQDIKVRCPFHEDTNASLKIDYQNQNDNAPHYSSSYCHTCQDSKTNTNIAQYWLTHFTERDVNENNAWFKARDMFSNKIVDKFFGEKENKENKNEVLTIGIERNYNYNLVKEAVLAIFDKDTLDNLNSDWELQLEYLVKMKELGVERQNAASPWSLVFKVGFGPDYNLGAVRYQPKLQPKVLMIPGTPTGIFMPFFLGEEEGKTNPLNIYDSNLIANRRSTLYIVEGQKDVLTLWLAGIPAITITGGAKALAQVPELFTDKNVFIIYDNDKAGVEGGRALGAQLAEYAKTVKVATNVYSFMEEKEDAFDFFFKYKKSKRDFAILLSNEDNFEVYDKAKVLAEKEAAEKEKESEAHKAKIEKLVKQASERVMPFNDIFSTDAHKLFMFEARLDKIESNVSHSIYLRPVIDIKDHRPYDEQLSFSIKKDLLALKEKIEVLNQYYRQTYGFDKFVITYREKEHNGDKLIVDFKIERILGHHDFDIIEQILMGRNGYGIMEAQSYIKAGVFKEVSGSITEFIRNLNKRWKRQLSKMEVEDDEDENVEEAKEETKQIVGKFGATGTPITVNSTTFNKKYSMDFTSVMVYEDKSHNEITETMGSYERVYRVYLPSHLLKGDTKIGDRITVYGGKLKKEVNNMPYVLGWHFIYRDPIDDFELTEVVKRSLDKFKVRGDDLDSLKRHQDRMFHLWRYHDNAAEFGRKMWESVELTYSSIARSGRIVTDGGVKFNKSALDIAIIGDSRTGKSKSVEIARDLYRTGTMIEMLNATPISIIGGSDTTKNNQVTLGTIPLNHRGLVQMDELSAIPDVDARDFLFKKLHVTRMDGITMIDRVSGKVAAPADVRLITTSNPVGSYGGSSSNPSMKTFRSSSYWAVVDRLLPSIPVKARFSFIYFPTTDEYAKEISGPNAPYSAKEIQKTIIDNDWHPLNRVDYMNKINWIWSRRPEQAMMTQEIFEYIKKQTYDVIRPKLHVENAEEIGIYTDGTTSQHIWNLSLAVAASTLSTDETYENVIVKEVHVDYAIEFLLSMYGEETGIPEMLDNTRKTSNISSEEVDLIFGDKPFVLSKFFKNKVLTLNEENDLVIRANLYQMYEQLYAFSTDGGEGASTNIAWAHVDSYFEMIMARWNEIVSNQGDSSRELFANIGSELMMRSPKELTGAWKQLMSKLGIIKERANQKQHFFLQSKFSLLWNEMKEKYSERYDIDTHEPKVKGN